MRNLTVIILALVFALGLSSCNNGQVELKARALDFVHKATDTNASITFMSPVMQGSMKTIMEGNPTFQSGNAGFAIPGAAMNLQRLGQDALSKVTDANLTTAVKGKWGQVTINITMPYGQEVIKTNWIKVDKVWYLYSGSGGEVTEYGEVPYFVTT
jgi:hypothetical protein